MSLIEERQRRILTTHVGSLPRPQSLSARLFARATGAGTDPKALADELQHAVGDIVKKQAELAIDVISDGELSKTSFQYYVTDRLSGIEPFTPKPGVRATRENRAFPTFYKDGSHSGTQPTRYACTGPLKYVGQQQVAADIANLKAALKGASPVDVFMPSVSPSSCVGLMENRHYKDDDEHLYAVAEALREEYQAIVAAGFMVQIDDPRLAMNYMLNPEFDVEQQRAWAAKRIAALNHALRGIPPSACATTPATASTWGRAPATSSSSIWPISSSRSTPAPIRSRWRTRATSTNGGCGRPSSCRRARC